VSFYVYGPAKSCLWSTWNLFTKLKWLCKILQQQQKILIAGRGMREAAAGITGPITGLKLTLLCRGDSPFDQHPPPPPETVCI